MAGIASQLENQMSVIFQNSNSRSYSNSISTIAVLIFFILMLVTPSSNQFERGLALAVILLGSTVYASSWRLDKAILIWLFTTTVVGLYSLINGVFINIENALRHSTIYLVWPIIFVYLVGFSTQPSKIILFLKAIVIGVFLSSIMGLVLVVLSTLDLYSGFIADFFENQGARSGYHDGYIKYRLYNVATLIYGVSFMYVIVADNMSENWMTKRWKIFIYVTIVLLMLATLISGRRGAWITILTAPAIHLLLSRIVGHKVPIKRILFAFIMFIPIFVTTVILFDLDISELFSVLQTVVEFEENASNIARAEQMDSLLAGWANSPLFGNGLGTSASIVRSDDLPWAYELSYIAVLFHTGLLGLIVYSGAIFWIFATGTRLMITQKISRSIFLPLLTGLACFLMANATNPYLSTFDYLWTIFLPLAAINSFRVKNI
jgi:hypothetical protein